MRCVSSDDVTISHGKQSTQKSTVIMDDCQPGKYIVCVYDKEWFLGIILMTSEEDQDVQVKFMMKSTQNHFNWPRRDNICSEKEFDNILNLFENFSVWIFYFAHFFHYDNLTAVLKFQVSNYTLL